MDNKEVVMGRLNDVTCPDCGRVLRFGGQFTYPDGRVVQEWVCWCGYEREELIKTIKKEKSK